MFQEQLKKLVNARMPLTHTLGYSVWGAATNLATIHKRQPPRGRELNARNVANANYSGALDASTGERLAPGGPVSVR